MLVLKKEESVIKLSCGGGEMICADLPKGPCIPLDRISMVYLDTKLRRLTTYKPRVGRQSMAHLKLPG